MTGNEFGHYHKHIAIRDVSVYICKMRQRQRIDSWLVSYGVYMICTVLAVSNLISVAYAQRATETNDETAMAIPRLVLPGSDRIDLPRPLSPSDVALMKYILNIQTNGAISDADREIARLEADWMVGPILASRYLDPGARPSAAELSEWLRRFGDQSDSAAIDARLRRLGEPTTLAHSNAAGVSAGAVTKRTRVDTGPGAIRTLFLHNRDAEAIFAAQKIVTSTDRAGASDDLLAAGLAAWRQNDRAAALHFFAAAYETARLSAGSAAAAYWMAHVTGMNGQPGESALWLRRAALARDTFYGRIARRKLGLIHPVHTELVSERTLGAIDFDRLLAIPRARRAFGLLQLGDKQRAEDELRALSRDLQTEPSLSRLLVVVAETAEMSRFAEELRTGYSTVSTVADTGIPRILRPEGGFIIDPTLVYGIVQHESNFHTEVVSSLGALGLMQIMPNTAIGIGALPPAQLGRLTEPAVNLSVGQRYMLVLANDPDIHGDLLRLLSAYGQGQGAMKRWVGSIHDGGDPLMFIEAVPSPVLRAFLFDALASSWRYAVTLRMPAPSLDALAERHYPTLTRPVSAALSGASAAQAARSGYLARARY
jgi:soluble lytic murein transglycosylase